MAIIPYEIPLTPVAQKFSIALGGQTYNLTVNWNSAPQGGWVLDIADESDEPIVAGIPLVTGADLLSQYQYLGFNGAMLVESDFDLYATPTFNNLGVNSHLFFLIQDGT